MFPGYIVCRYPVFTIYATCNVASHVKSFVLLHQSFLKYVCSAQCGGFLFLYFVFSQLLSYFLNDFEIVPVVPILTGIAFVFTLHMNCISVVRLYVLESSQLISLSHFCLLKLQHLLIYMFFFSLSWIIMSGLLSGVVLLVYICWFYNMVILLSGLKEAILLCLLLNKPHMFSLTQHKFI